MPIHLGMHWAAVVVDIPMKEIGYYDSLSYPGTTCLNTIRYMQTTVKSY